MNHFDDFVAHIFAVQHAIALAVDGVALHVHDVVVIQHLFTSSKVVGFHLLLCALNGFCQYSRLNGFVLRESTRFHEFLHPLTAEEAHEFIFQRDEELGSTGIALSTGSATQLVINASCFMTLGAQNEQSADGFHLFRIFFGFDGKFFLQTLEFFPGIQNFTSGNPGLFFTLFACTIRREGFFGFHMTEAVGPFDEFRTVAVFFHLFFRHPLSVAAQHNIGTTAGHIGRDGHFAEATGLRDDFRFVSMLFGVKNMMFDAGFLEHLGDLFGRLDIDGADQNRLPRGMNFLNLPHDGTEFRFFMGIDGIFPIDTSDGLVSRNFNYVDVINFTEFIRFGKTGSGHAGQLFIHTEEVLEGNRRKRLRLTLDGNAFFRFNSLV